MSMNMKNDSSPSLLVKFMFEGDKKSEIALLTFEQYSNIKDLPITKECKIVKNERPTLSEGDIVALEAKITEVFSKSKSHTESLSQ